MRQHTALTQQDLQVYLSQRNTDTPDGGGKMTATVLTGEDNQLFPPVSDVDRVNGRVNARQLYCAVLKPVAAALWGANVIIGEPPKSPNVSFLIFAADHYGQERKAAMARVEAYAVPASRSRMVLLNTQLKGSRIITAYQRPEYPLPLVGERYCLQYFDEKRQKSFAYFRVVKIIDEVRTFVDGYGEFQRRVLKLEIQDPLPRDFEGMSDAVRGGAVPEVLILETQISDAGRYYGIRPLAAPVRAGDVQVRVDSIFEKLVPTATVETSHVDDFSGGKALWVPSGTRRKVAQAGWIADGNLYLDTPVLPGSIELGSWTDDASGSLKNGSAVLAVDYAKGVIYGIKALHIGEVYAQPALPYYNYAYTSALDIDQTNIGTEHVLTLRPRPAAGSVSVAYRAGRSVYWLHDAGDGYLRDAQGNRRGKVERSGSVQVSLPGLPDDGSQLVCYWSPAAYYQSAGGGEAGAAVKPSAADALALMPPVPKPLIKPGSLRLSWHDGVAQRAAQDENGELAGSVQGYIDYPAGKVHLRGLNTAALTMTAEQYIAAPELQTVKVEDTGAAMQINLKTAVQRGSLWLRLPLGRREQIQVDSIQPPSTPSYSIFKPTALSAVSSTPRTPSGGGRRRSGERLATAA